MTITFTTPQPLQGHPSSHFLPHLPQGLPISVSPHESVREVLSGKYTENIYRNQWKRAWLDSKVGRLVTQIACKVDRCASCLLRFRVVRGVAEVYRSLKGRMAALVPGVMMSLASEVSLLALRILGICFLRKETKEYVTLKERVKFFHKELDQLIAISGKLPLAILEIYRQDRDLEIRFGSLLGQVKKVKAAVKRVISFDPENFTTKDFTLAALESYAEKFRKAEPDRDSRAVNLGLSFLLNQMIEEEYCSFEKLPLEKVDAASLKSAVDMIRCSSQKSREKIEDSLLQRWKLKNETLLKKAYEEAPKVEALLYHQMTGTRRGSLLLIKDFKNTPASLEEKLIQERDNLNTLEIRYEALRKELEDHLTQFEEFLTHFTSKQEHAKTPAEKEKFRTDRAKKEKLQKQVSKKLSELEAKRKEVEEMSQEIRSIKQAILAEEKACEKSLCSFDQKIKILQAQNAMIQRIQSLR